MAQGVFDWDESDYETQYEFGQRYAGRVVWLEERVGRPRRRRMSSCH